MSGPSDLAVQEPTALAEADPEVLAGIFAEAGFRPAHARTVLRHLYFRKEGDPALAARVGRGVLDLLASRLPWFRSTIRRRVASADGTVKLGIGYPDGAVAEAVLMPMDRRLSACLSSQVGCAMACRFCASGVGGLERDLTSGEIVEQYLHLTAEARAFLAGPEREILARNLATQRPARRPRKTTNPKGATQPPVKNIVFMGMGEPLHNYGNVVAAIRRLIHPHAGRFAPDHITVSTVGVVPRIHDLIRDAVPVHLAVSLHAPDDATRERLIPANRRWGVAEIVKAMAAFLEKTGRHVTVEYTLLADVNDAPGQAEELAALLAGRKFHVNLIPWNAVPGLPFAAPAPERVRGFLKTLMNRGVIAHVRIQRGGDVAGACGQLRRAGDSPRSHEDTKIHEGSC